MEDQNTQGNDSVQQQPQQQQPAPVQQPAMQQAVPNATAALVLGIISIPTCFCYGIVGLVVGIIGLVLAGKAKKLYEENPQAYTDSSFSNLKAGRVCSIIGVALGALYLVFIIFYISMIGMYALSLGTMLEELGRM